MIKAVIFDMFETLITHFESPLYMGKQISADMDLAEPTFREIWDTSDDDRTLGKSSLEEVIETILRVNDRYTPELFDSIIQKRRASKEACFDHLHPEIIPMLSELKSMGLQVGLITNCYFEESDIIRKSALFPFFDVVCMSCELGLKKPDPRIFQLCTERLSLSPGECLYVGDGGSHELEAAKAFGMHPLQAAWYLKEGTKQPAKRKPGFAQADLPLDVVDYLQKI